MDLMFREDEDTGSLHVDARAPCGDEFKDIAVVASPRSENPMISIERPIGFRAVKAILDYVDRRKKRCEKLN